MNNNGGDEENSQGGKCNKWKLLCNEQNSGSKNQVRKRLENNITRVKQLG